MKRLVGRIARVSVYALAAACVLVVLAVGALWFWPPSLSGFKPEIERLLSEYLDKDISMADVSVARDGFHVTFRASGVRVAVQDQSGSGMRFGEMLVTLDPLSLLSEHRTFERLELVGPTIEAARLPDGRIRVGDTILGTPRGTLRRLLQGRHLEITNGTLVWRDALSAESELHINDVHVLIETEGQGRRFAFTASAPAGLMRGFKGNGTYDPRALTSGSWTASVNVDVDHLNLASIPALIQERLPWESEGTVDTDLHAEWTRGVFTTASAELTARDFIIPYAKDKTPLAAGRFSSSVSWQREESEWRLVFTKPEIVLDGEPVSVSRFELERRGEQRIYSARDANAQDLLGVVKQMDIELPWPELIDSLQPRGVFSSAALTLSGPYLEATGWRFEGDFRNVGWRAQERYPGLQGASGHLTVDEKGGELSLASSGLVLDADDSLRQPVGFDRVAADAEWYRWGSDWVVDVKNGAVSNEDMDLTDVNLYTRVPAQAVRSPFVLARFRVERADVAALRDYLPVKRMSAKQAEWLDRALVAGELTEGRFYLNGRLDRIPYDTGSGELRFSGRVRGGVLDFHEKWPQIRSLDGELTLDNARLEARVEHGVMMSSEIRTARVWSDDFFERDRLLLIDGEMKAQADDVVQFLRRGPLNRDPPPPYSIMTARGEGLLSLAIELPFTRLKEESRVQGTYVLEGAAVEVADGIEFTGLSGEVRFTEGSVEGQGIEGMLFGGPVKADVATVEAGRPMTFAISGTGETDVSRLTPVVGPVMVSRLAGRARWTGRFVGGPGTNTLDVQSDLDGVDIRFPHPMRKAARDEGGIDVHVEFEDDRRRIALTLEDRMRGRLHYDRQEDRTVLTRGVLNLGADREMPDSELAVSVEDEHIDMDEWIAELVSLTRRKEQEQNVDPGRDSLFDHLRSVDLDVNRFRYLDRELGPVVMDAVSSGSGPWAVNITGPRLEGTGSLEFDEEPGAYEFTMSRLYWPQLQSDPRDPTYKKPGEPSEFPRLSISAEDFRFGDIALGRLELRAEPVDNEWRIRRLSLQQPELSIEATGAWSSGIFADQRTRINASAGSESLGKALARLGLENQVAKGAAEMIGDLSWPGGPGDFGLGKLNGSLSLYAENGRFLKLEPGSGRLLGLFNVEALTRRFRLDFTDVFQEGLGFDRIEGQADITAGRLETDGIFVASPAALLEIGGSTHLGERTLDLEVKVAPQFGANLSLAGAIANPAAGAMLFVMQKLFKKQMANLIHYTYRVTGAWTAPAVEAVLPPEPPGRSGRKN